MTNLEPYRLVLDPSKKGRNLDIATFNRMMRRNAKQRAPEVMLKITSFCKDASDFNAHVDYVSRNGKITMYDSMDVEIDRHQVQNDLSHMMLEQQGREHGNTENRTMNFMLSMPRGTHKEKFKSSVSHFLHEEFGHNHDYHYCFHDDSKSGTYHAHVIMQIEGRDFNKLSHRKEDLIRWRVNFADKLEMYGIEANATRSLSRGVFSKDTPTYKYHRNIGTVMEHGEAPYKFDHENNLSYYVTLDMGINPVTGKKKWKTIWAKGLKEPMQKAEAEGSLIGEVKIARDTKEKKSIRKRIYKGGDFTGRYKTIEPIISTWKIVQGDELIKELGQRKESRRIVRNKYIDAWKVIYTNAIEMGDDVAAKGVANIVQDCFGINEQELMKKKPKQKSQKIDRTR